MSTYKINNLNSIYISAAHKSSGKTIISIGLSRIFSNLNINIQTYKKGPDYIDMGWLSAASRNNCYNLDFNTQTKDEIVDLYNKKNLDFNIIEGNKGLYDGLDVFGSDDNSAMAMLLNTAVILVINVQGITRGIAPLIQGYINFEKKCKIKGVILNKVSTERHESKLIQAVENYTDLKIFGSIRKNDDLIISERHIGLIPANEKKIANKKINSIAKIIESSIDKNEFSKLGIEFKKINNTLKRKDRPIYIKSDKNIKLGIFYDSSFGFYYSDDIENFIKYGADIIYIDAIKDNKLPLVDALFIGGGFPEINAGKLEKNKILIKEIKKFIEEGKPCYVECGGLMYLAEYIYYKNKKFKMVGIIPGHVNMCKKPVGRGYVKLNINKSHPWKIKNKKLINAHEFHHANLIFNKTKKCEYAYDVKRGYGSDGKHDGYIYKNLLANFSHLRHTKKYPWIKYFMNFIEEKKND